MSVVAARAITAKNGAHFVWLLSGRPQG